MAGELQVGSKIPPFFVKDHDGYDVKDVDVIGTPMVIFFYKRDSSKFCTEEICSFRDHQQKFDVLHTLLIGVSPDSVESHKKNVVENKLHYSLLSDVKKDMCRMYGVINEKEEVIRTTFVVSSRGIIKWMEKPVNIKGHIERVIKAIEEHCNEPIIDFDNYEKDYAEFLEGKLKRTPDEKKIHEQILKDFGIKKRDIEKK